MSREINLNEEDIEITSSITSTRNADALSENELLESSQYKIPLNLFENISIAMGIITMSYIGSLIRLGVGYYKIWPTDTNYCVMYANLLGSAIFGFMCGHRTFLMKFNSKLITKVIYISVTSGLCGSITSFSAWQMICSNNFMLQWDISAYNINSSYNGGRLIEWLVSLIAGVVLPLAALKFGFHCATLSGLSNSNSSALDATTTDNEIEKISAKATESFPNAVSYQQIQSSADDALSKGDFIFQLILIVVLVVSTCIVIVVPWLLSPAGKYSYIAYTTIFGACGALVRFYLSHFNARTLRFPLGTFIANLSATWLTAAMTLISNYFVGYYDAPAQRVLFGLIVGFEGCLSTTSTFVYEIDVLSIGDAYIYGVVSNVVAQIGVILIYCVFAFSSVKSVNIASSSINVCSAFEQLCDQFLISVDCPASQKVVFGCQDFSNYETYEGRCSCGGFVTNRLSELLVEAQSKAYITQSIVQMWPTKFDEIDDATQVFDYCQSFDNVCNLFLDNIGCPVHQRFCSACHIEGLLQTSHTACECGSFFSSSNSIAELLFNHALSQRYDLIPYAGYLTLSSINFSNAFESICTAALDHIQCPLHERSIVGIANSDSSFSSWKGLCACGSSFDGNGKWIPRVIFSELLAPKAMAMITPAISNNGSRTYDMCSSYTNLCSAFMDYIHCPGDQRLINACNASNTIIDYVGRCSCGSMTILEDAPAKMIVDLIVSQELKSRYYSIPPPTSPYITVASSSAIAQLMH